MSEAASDDLTQRKKENKMIRNSLTLALATALVLVPVVSQASDNFVSRMFTEPDGHGRWVDRRLTLRHHDQDAPSKLRAARHEDGFLGRAFTEPDARGRWINRRLTFRHEGQDAPRVACRH